MEIVEVGQKEYANIINPPFHVFGSASFNELNKSKCDKLFYLLFREGKFRLGIIGGIRDNIFHSPISAPFGGFSFVSGDIRIQYIEEAIKMLKFWVSDKKLSSIRMTIPPLVYESSFIAKQINCLWRMDFKISAVDLNYSFNLDRFSEGYADRIWYNARKNLRISMEAGLGFEKCKNDDEKKLAYDIISKNRESRGYPLRMSWQNVLDTIQIVPADFFLVHDEFENTIASAIVFYVAKIIAQVIYWRDIHEHANLKTMNYLSYKVLEYYKKEGLNIVDLGPSTENSIPNYGLAEFKESIGCVIHPKYTFNCNL